jgi:HEAT repeat protein
MLPTLFLMLRAFAAPRPPSPVLKSIADNPYALVNVSAADMPASPDVLQLGKRSTRALSRCLADNPDANLRSACAEMLGTLGDASALPTLHAALEDWEPQVRLRVIQALGQIAAPQSAQPMIAAWSRAPESSNERAAILTSLAALGSGPAVSFIRHVFDDSDELGTVAYAAIWRNRHLVGKSIMIEETDRALRKDDESLQHQAALKAAQIRSPKLVRSLVRRIDASDANLRNKVIRALGLIGDKRAEPALLRLLPSVRDARLLNNLAFALERIDRPAFFTEVEKLITHKQAIIRMNAAFVVGDVRRQEGLPLLGKALADPSDRVRLMAIEAARKLPDPAPLLVQAMGDSDEGVRVEAVAAGDQLSRPLPLLSKAMRDSSDRVRLQAVEVASQLPHPPAPLLISALKDPVEAVQRAALEGIHHGKLSLAIPALQPFLTDPRQPLFEPAIYALHDLAAGDPLWSATPAGSGELIHRLLFTSDNPGVRHRAALALAALGDPRVHEYAVTCLLSAKCTLPEVSPLLEKERDESVIRRLQLQWVRGKPELAPLIVKLRPPGASELARADLELRDDGDHQGILNSAEILAELHENAARPQVAARLDGAGAWQRLRLLLLLGRLGDSQAAQRVAALLDELPVEWLPVAASLLSSVEDPGEREALAAELSRREGRADYRLELAVAAVQLAWQPKALPPRLLDGVVARRPRERELSRRYLRAAPAETLSAALAREKRAEVREALLPADEPNE